MISYLKYGKDMSSRGYICLVPGPRSRVEVIITIIKVVVEGERSGHT